MSANGKSASRAEWDRIELLAHLLAGSRQGEQAPEKALAELSDLQGEVERERARGGSLAGLAPEPLQPIEYDVLACALAPEVEPHLGWMFQSLQAGTQPYPTPALVQELFALDGERAGSLHAAVAEDGRLARLGLVTQVEPGPFQPLRPRPESVASLQGRPAAPPSPPGTSRVTVRPTWDDLVLPPDRQAMLREFLAWIRHRDTVFGKWRAVACGGPVALLSGPSGTGKTFAAAVVATDLAWPLYRVDLGTLVSKYIGETEKNLNRLFDAAHGREMVLQFDEADSLFSKRGEVREARDRYANMEVSHLLARIESHEGPCVLTTNLRGNLDPAFARRFQVVVDFPRPDAAARTELWRRLLPPEAPGVAELDCVALGHAVNLTGGSIRNAALHAAFLAAAAGAPITLERVALAVWRELSKEGREVSRLELGALAEHLPEGAAAC